MSNIYYLKAVDEQTMWDALVAVGRAEKVYDPMDPANQPPEEDDINNPWVPTGAYTYRNLLCDLDIIGTIYAATGPVDPESGQPTQEPIDNFFYANLRTTLTDEQAALLPTVPAPATPYRVWAGDN